ncbi:hypothetical protein F53441_9348 [Fusarium austroafricanum]|uniref:Uncharacterized protein n=1 Tax=Fusarium austroafricanum TaxID=2364996 RepID=A0A8H4KBX5_9HYPO|nr:hypothetical protein F53441_9348 [Fusarium austroafricanum]
MPDLPTRSIFATDISDPSDGSNFEFYGALEVGFDERSSPNKIQVVFRTLEGVPFDISELVSFNKGESDENLEVSMIQGSGDLPLSSFTIKITSLKRSSSRFKGSISERGDKSPRIWLGHYVGFTKSPIEVIRKGPRQIPQHVKTFLDITPHRFDSNGERWDYAHEWSGDLLHEMLLNSLPTSSRQLFFKDLPPLGDSLRRHLNSELPAASHKTNYFDIPTIFKVNEHTHEVVAVHLLFHELKSAEWFPEECRAYIIDKFNDLFNLLKCSDAEIDNMRIKYGEYLPASQVTGMLREEFMDSVMRTYHVAYMNLEAERWEEVLGKQPDATSVLNDVIKVLQSDYYKQHILPRFINSPSDAHGLSVSQHIALMADKMHLLRHLGDDKVNESQVKEVVLELLNAASLTGIARQSLIEVPNLLTKGNQDAHLDAKRLMNEMMKSNFSISINGSLPEMTNLQKKIRGDFSVKFTYPDGESSQTIHNILILDTGGHGLYKYEWPRPDPGSSCVIL